MSLNQSSIARIAKTVSMLMLVTFTYIPKVLAQNFTKNPILPDGLGLAIHFTTPQPGEMDQLAKTGSRIVRTDLVWHRTETSQGEYDFSAYDRLVQELAQKNIRIMFILDYANPLYDQGLAPYTDAGRQAFAKWTAAAVQHFQGRNIIWEMWNEPNLPAFWKPQPNVENYAKLALTVGKVIRSVAPKEIFIGPATSGIDFAFLEACFKAGLLNYWSGISVHPYRGGDIESVNSEYRGLRLLISKYAPKNKFIPVISGEWGYASMWKTEAQMEQNSIGPSRFSIRVDENTQAKYLSRQFLNNIANNVPISIWYDWHDDGPSPVDYQHHFGITRYPYRLGVNQAYAPKPAYNAIRTLTTLLQGYRFNKQIYTGSPQDYVLLFNKGQQIKLAVWTSSLTPRTIQIPVSSGKFQVISHIGGKPTLVSTDTNMLSINATNAPQYIVPIQSNDLLQIARAWERLPPEIIQSEQTNINVNLNVKNPLPKEIQVSSNAQSITIPPYQTQRLSTQLERPSDTDLTPISIRLDVQGMGTLTQNSLVGTNPFGRTNPPPSPESSTVNLAELATNSSTDPFQLVPDGDPNVFSQQSFSVFKLPSNELSFPNKSVLKINYAFENGWKFARLVPPQLNTFKNIDGKPKAVGIWVYGDGSGNWASVRVTDATKQTFQAPLQAITWNGWRYVTFSLDGFSCTSWGGANDKLIHYPIQWSTVFAIASAKSQKTQGEIYIGDLTYIW